MKKMIVSLALVLGIATAATAERKNLPNIVGTFITSTVITNGAADVSLDCIIVNPVSGTPTATISISLVNGGTDYEFGRAVASNMTSVVTYPRGAVTLGNGDGLKLECTITNTMQYVIIRHQER